MTRTVLLHGRFFLGLLQKLPTLAQSQADDLKIDKDGVRVWLSRATVEDGAPFNHEVTIETYRQSTGQWHRWRSYEAWDGIRP